MTFLRHQLILISTRLHSMVFMKPSRIYLEMSSLLRAFISVLSLMKADGVVVDFLEALSACEPKIHFYWFEKSCVNNWYDSKWKRWQQQSTFVSFTSCNNRDSKEMKIDASGHWLKKLSIRLWLKLSINFRSKQKYFSILSLNRELFGGD